jgi:hypothetical protein
MVQSPDFHKVCGVHEEGNPTQGGYLERAGWGADWTDRFDVKFFIGIKSFEIPESYSGHPGRSSSVDPPPSLPTGGSLPQNPTGTPEI